MSMLASECRTTDSTARRTLRNEAAGTVKVSLRLMDATGLEVRQASFDQAMHVGRIELQTSREVGDRVLEALLAAMSERAKVVERRIDDALTRHRRAQQRECSIEVGLDRVLVGEMVGASHDLHAPSYAGAVDASKRRAGVCFERLIEVRECLVEHAECRVRVGTSRVSAREQHGGIRGPRFGRVSFDCYNTSTRESE